MEKDLLETLSNILTYFMGLYLLYKIGNNTRDYKKVHLAVSAHPHVISDILSTLIIGREKNSLCAFSGAKGIVKAVRTLTDVGSKVFNNIAVCFLETHEV